jgi:hypothetical protein
MVKMRKRKQEEVKFVLQRHVKNGGMVSLTLDGWTSCSQHNYLAVTGHFVERICRGKPSTLRSLLLAFRPLPASHNAERQAAILTAVTEEFGITGHIRSITSDNASINQAMANVLQTDERWGKFTVQDCFVGCFAHILNLAAQEILTVLNVDKEAVNEDKLSKDDTAEPDITRADTDNEQAAVAAILHVARKIVAKTRKSNILGEALAEFERVKGLKQLKLLLDVCTRWNSTHLLIQRLLEVRPAVDRMCRSEPKLFKLNLMLDDFDWAWLEKLNTILAVFSKPTEDISGERYPTLSQQLPAYWKIANRLREQQKEFAPGGEDHNDTAWEACEAALDKLNHYRDKTDSFTAQRIATILDPRLKLVTLERQGWRPCDLRAARNSLERVLREYYPSDKTQHLTSSQSDSISDSQPEETLDPEDLLIFGPQEPAQAAPTGSGRGKQQQWKVELQRYLDTPSAAMTTDIIAWWDIHELEYPHLAKVARDYAAIPGSSVPRYVYLLGCPGFPLRLTLL